MFPTTRRVAVGGPASRPGGTAAADDRGGDPGEDPGDDPAGSASTTSGDVPASDAGRSHTGGPGHPLSSVPSALPHPVTAPAAINLPGRHRAVHRRIRFLRTGPVWPLVAVVVVGLAAAPTLGRNPLPGDGALAGPATDLLRGEEGLTPFSPGGLGAVHTAVYGAVSRAFQRQATLAGAEREVLLVLLLVSAVLLWRTARRLAVPDAACAAAILLLGALPGLAPLHAAATPAAFAVPWLLLAAWLGTWVRVPGRVPAAVAGLALLAAVLALLLAPDVLLLLVAGSTAVAAAQAGSGRRRVAVAVAGGLLLIGARVLVQHWDPQPSDPGRWGGTSGGLLLLTASLVLVGLLAARRLPRLRASGVALTATALLGVAPPSGRLPALLLCVPLAALLAGALGAAAAERLAFPDRRARPLLAAGILAVVLAVVLAGLGTVGAAGLTAGTRSDFGAAEYRGLVAWAAGQLPEDAVVTAPARIAAELVHAGADPDQVHSGQVAPQPAARPGAGPVLQVTTGPAPPGRDLVARFGALAVVDPQPLRPAPDEVAARRDLAAAMLANPTTEASARDAEVLAAGRVDPRLLSLLAGVGARYGLGLHSLPAVPGEARGVLVRQAVIASVGGRAVTDDPAAARQLRGWVDAQQEPFAPDRVSEVDGGLLVGYDLVRDPDGLLPRSGRG